jgi:hypothetical protein
VEVKTVPESSRPESVTSTSNRELLEEKYNGVEDRKYTISHYLEIDLKNCSRGYRNETSVSCSVEVEQTAENSFSAELERRLPDFDAAVYGMTDIKSPFICSDQGDVQECYMRSGEGIVNISCMGQYMVEEQAVTLMEVQCYKKVTSNLETVLNKGDMDGPIDKTVGVDLIPEGAVSEADTAEVNGEIHVSEHDDIVDVEMGLGNTAIESGLNGAVPLLLRGEGGQERRVLAAGDGAEDHGHQDGQAHDGGFCSRVV